MGEKTRTGEARPPLCHVGPAANAARTGSRGRGSGVAALKRHEDDNFRRADGSKRIGAAFEARALEYLRRQGLRLVTRNFTCRGGEIDLVMRDSRDGALVFVEVRARSGAAYGGAVASVGLRKRRRLLLAARFFLVRTGDKGSACRFDVVAFEGGRLQWLRDAFGADDG